MVSCLAVVAPAAWAQSPDAAAGEHQHAHVHGAAKLGIAVEDKTVSLQLESPLDSLIGFEHRPSTQSQRAAAEALRLRMRAPADLFAFDAAANCTLAKADAQSAIFEAADRPVEAGAAAGAHADLDASFEYRCEHPERLSRVDIGLLRAYPKLQRLDVEIATPKGQFKRELRPPARTVSLTR